MAKLTQEYDLELKLHAYVDGNLDEESMAEVEEYLLGHPDVAAKVREYLQHRDDIRGYALQEVEKSAAPRLYALAGRLAKRLKSSRPFGWKRTILVGVTFATGWLGHSIYEPWILGPEFTDEVVNAHLLTSSDPTEVLPLTEERLAKLSARIGELALPPDLRTFGYEPVGAQLLPSDEGLVLHVPYRNQLGSTVSYFLLHDFEVDEVPRHFLRRAGVSMIYWQHEHSRFAVATSHGDEQISKMADFIDSPRKAL